MKTTFSTLFIIGLFAAGTTACDRGPTEGALGQGENNDNPSEAVEPDPNDDGVVTYDEQSPHSEITTRTTNYAGRADSIRTARDTLVDPTYTDDEYEAAFSTSTTNPENQVEGGITPGDQQKRNQ